MIKCQILSKLSEDFYRVIINYETLNSTRQIQEILAQAQQVQLEINRLVLLGTTLYGVISSLKEALSLQNLEILDKKATIKSLKEDDAQGHEPEIFHLTNRVNFLEKDIVQKTDKLDKTYIALSENNTAVELQRLTLVALNKSRATRLALNKKTKTLDAYTNIKSLTELSGEHRLVIIGGDLDQAVILVDNN